MRVKQLGGRDSGNNFGPFFVLGYPTKKQLCSWSLLPETTQNKALSTRNSSILATVKHKRVHQLTTLLKVTD